MSGWIEAISQIAASALLASVWQGILLAGIIWICIKLAPRTTAGIRFLVWMAVFLTVALLSFLLFSHFFFFRFVFPRFPARPPSSPSITTTLAPARTLLRRF